MVPFSPIPLSVLTDGLGQICAQRSKSLPKAYDNWKAIGDAQPHWGRKHAQEDHCDPLVVKRNNEAEGWAIAVPLCFREDCSYASTGTYRFVDAGSYTPEAWRELKEGSFNGYYYLPVPNPHKTEPYTVWAQRG